VRRGSTRACHSSALTEPRISAVWLPSAMSLLPLFYGSNLSQKPQFRHSKADASVTVERPHVKRRLDAAAEPQPHGRDEYTQICLFRFQAPEPRPPCPRSSSATDSTARPMRCDCRAWWRWRDAGFVAPPLRGFQTRLWMNRGTIGFLMNEYKEDDLIERVNAAERAQIIPLSMVATGYPRTGTYGPGHQ
jgi:hypothetical protein